MIDTLSQKASLSAHVAQHGNSSNCGHLPDVDVLASDSVGGKKESHVNSSSLRLGVCGKAAADKQRQFKQGRRRRAANKLLLADKVQNTCFENSCSF